MAKEHTYKTLLNWTGNKGQGTANYRAYDRNHVISIAGKDDIKGSSDPSFLGDPTRYNPEELLVASLSSCHMLWYLHLCATNQIVVVDYQDKATGIMQENADGSGQFAEVTLKPEVTITEPEKIELANSLHHQANQMCFIARSCNFPVRHQPSCKVAEVQLKSSGF